MELAPKEAERKPAKVTPSCTVDRKRLGFRATRATLAPRSSSCSSCSSCEVRKEIRAISVPEKTDPMSMKMMMAMMSIQSDDMSVPIP